MITARIDSQIGIGEPDEAAQNSISVYEFGHCLLQQKQIIQRRLIGRVFIP
jgi:hypothetical protein